MAARSSLSPAVFDIEEIVTSLSDVIVEGWTKAIAQGWDDIVFVWMIEGEDLRSICMKRESVLAALRNSESSIPSDILNGITKIIETPAGDGKAWLVLSGPGILSSLCLEYVKIVPRHLLN